MAEALREWDEPEAAPVAAEAGGDDVAVAEAPAEAPVPPSSPSEPDPLDKLLSAYDEGVGNGAGNGASADLTADFSADELARLLGEAGQDEATRRQRDLEWQKFQQQTAQQEADASIAVAQRDRQIGELQQTVGELQNVLWQEQQRQHRQRSKADFDALIAPVQAELEAEGLDIPPDYVETQLIAAGARDPALIEAWESRYFEGHDPLRAAQLEAAIRQQGETWAKAALAIANPAQRLAAQRHIEAWMRRAWQAAFVDPQEHRAKGAATVRRAVEQIVKQARRPPIDRQISADYFAVAQAVRGASSSKPPPDPPVNLGRMSEGEFRRHTLERYGF